MKKIYVIVLAIAMFRVMAAEAVEFQLAAGGAESVAVTPDGRVLQWGKQGGPLPVPLMGIDHVTAVAVGHEHILALKNDGTVWAWGSNDYGQLGDTTAIPHDRPVQVYGMTGAVAVAAGSFHSYALKNDGTIWAWGDNRNGQLGDGSRNNRRTPVLVENFLDVQSIAAGSTHLLVLRKDGTVCSWGLSAAVGSDGRIQNTFLGKPEPICLKEFSGVASIAAGGNASYAVKLDGTLWAWGASVCGDARAFVDDQFQRPILDRVKKVSAGALHTLILRDDGSLWACGSNDAGQLGTGDLVTSNPSTGLQRDPAEIRAIFNVTDMAAGYRHSLAKNEGGLFWSWGDNSQGQLATGDHTSRSTPAVIWDGTGELSNH